jgi:hypothetical protein
MSYLPFGFGGRPRLRGGSPSSWRMNAAIPASPALSASRLCSSGVTGSRMSIVADTCAFLFGMSRIVTRASLARKRDGGIRNCGDNSIVPTGKGSYNNRMNNGTNNNAGKVEKFYHFNAANEIVVGFDSTIDEASASAARWNKSHRNDESRTVAFIGNARRLVEATRVRAVN